MEFFIGTKLLIVFLILAVLISGCTGQKTATSTSTSSPILALIPDPKIPKIAIGNWGYGSDGDLSFQNDPRLTWDEVVSPNNIRPNVTSIWQQPIYSGLIPQTNFNFMRSRFDLATKNKDKNWTYGTYLLLEELFHPSVRAKWFPSIEGLKSWDIEGNETFAGVNIMHIKPWYIAKYGKWNQYWWDRVKAGNEYNDRIVWAWSVYYGYNLHKAWHLHMRSLGKKSAIVGIIGLDGMDWFETFTYPSPMWQYVTANYDLIFTYQYPGCVSSGCSQPISRSLDEVKLLREKYNYKGKLVHILTSLFPNGVGTDNEIVQFEEFKAVYPYVDVIVCMPYTNVNVDPPGIDPKLPYPPRLIKFYNSVNP
jgi:hypothetical protein